MGKFKDKMKGWISEETLTDVEWLIETEAWAVANGEAGYTEDAQDYEAAFQ